ncbi:MAG: undecaprenyldiphospho-muramoylpentapeptide beta-N-acetylglucosaminyltransferase [Gemmatimonadaceae bacterium]
MRVLFAGGGTGGHLYPGLAIARALVRLHPAIKPFFVGAQRGIERDVLPTCEFPYRLLDVHPLYRTRPWRNWRTVRGLVGAWSELGSVNRELRPALLVATGGYAAGAALAFAVSHRVPFVLQEQNAFPGLTQRVFAHRASEVFLGFPEAANRFVRGDTTAFINTGNPIEPPPQPPPDRAAARRSWGLPESGGTVVLIFGGSQGARPLNEAVAQWIDRGLSPSVYLIWATGRSSYDRYAALDSSAVRVRPYLAPIAGAYGAADIAITRAGAMTTAELCAWGLPAILVPLPTAAADHQSANARALAADTAAIHLPQRDLTAASLREHVNALVENPTFLHTLSARAAARGRPHAADAIARRILGLLQLLPTHS